jgi:hypothetical protein
MNTIVLAFDIERSGAGLKHDTIAIGASVLDHEFKELDRLFLPGYTDETKFEQRCMDEFWSQNKDVLETLRYTGQSSYQERQKEMIMEFQNFRKKWEIHAMQNNLRIELISDNNVFDGGFINKLIGDYTGDMLLPYSASGRKYKSFWETHSEQRGLLMVIDPSYKKNYGFTKRIYELYDVSKPDRKHDHNPANDAYTIGYEQQVLLNIQNGRIKLRNMYAGRNIGIQSMRLGMDLGTRLWNNVKDFSVKQYKNCQSKRRRIESDVEKTD